ncbi:outer dynein arm-docking complex subunit 3-like [Erpetoichthys calabaricus]|uniref:outer dynein arm-docking complex subunit 3-like n=1 Tax=Erpetoichthys calabaricus TaxID=27687 RepID=UPI00223433B1|nr:outer dynein arm-docking complex subunit 3-like [Erpetoichthys calabaricus]
MGEMVQTDGVGSDKQMRTNQKIQEIISKNNVLILQMKLDNNLLKKKLDEKMERHELLSNELVNKEKGEKGDIKHVTGKSAVQKLEKLVNKKIWQLNSKQHVKEARKRRLEELKQQHSSHIHTVRTEQDMCSQEEHKQRVLQSSLEEAQMKFEEAEHLTHIYHDIKKEIQGEILTFKSRMETIKAEVERQKQVLIRLRHMQKDVCLSKDEAKAALQRHKLLAERKHHARELLKTKYAKQAEKERDRLDSVTWPKQPQIIWRQSRYDAPEEEEAEKEGDSLEEAFGKLREATGATDTEKVVQFFICQGDTQKRLEHLAAENDMLLQCLKEEQKKLKDELNQIKYSGGARIIQEKKEIEDLTYTLEAELKRRDEAKKWAKELSNRTLNKVRAVLETLVEKLQHISKPKISPLSVRHVPSLEEYVLDLLSSVEKQLMVIMEEFRGKDLATIQKEMKDSKKDYSVLEEIMPPTNVRIKLPMLPGEEMDEEIEDSEEEDPDVLTREQLKRQSQKIVNSKKRRG